MPRSKPNRYESDIAGHLAEVEKLAETLTDLELAKVLGIGKTAFKRYKVTYPEFREAIARGKAIRGCNYEKLIKPRLAEIAEMYQTMSENEIISEIGVSKTSWSEYKATHPELKEALQRGREKLCTRVKKALLEAAEGYEYTETEEIRELTEDGGMIVTRTRTMKRKAKKDVVAAHLLLKNNDPDWRNDDFQTMELKKKQVDIAQQKAEDANW